MERDDAERRLAAAAGEIIRVLASPRRLQIMMWLADGDATAATLASGLSVESSCLAHHLRQLRYAGLVSRQRQAGRLSYRLADEGIRPLLRECLRYAASRDGTG